MATYTITIDEKSETGRKLVAFLGSLKEVISLKKTNRSNSLDESIEDVKKGKIYKAKDADDLIKKCLL